MKSPLKIFLGKSTVFLQISSIGSKFQNFAFMLLIVDFVAFKE